MILVIGHGVTGRAVERWARARGHEVLVVDDAPSRAAGVADTEAGLAALEETALVVPSPGVRPTHPILAGATAKGIPISSEIDLAVTEAPVTLVAVTGTNGKTTVTTLITEMLTASGVLTRAAGNTGRPVIEAVGQPCDVIVVEASSFQLATTTRFRPRVAVLLNVADDHLDWHGSFDAYARAKARVFARQADDDVLVSNADDPVVVELAATAPARTLTFSTTDDVKTVLTGADLPPHVDLSNALAAAVAAREVGATDEGIQEGLARVARLPHRVAPVGEAGGVRWIDDSKATNPHAANHAIARFESVVLIAGGRNKGLDLGVLRRHEDRIRAVVAMGESAEEVAAAFAGSSTPTECVDSMHAAVDRAATVARAGDTVLLSPACTSFDAYESYEERGDAFAAEVREMTGRVGSGGP